MEAAKYEVTTTMRGGSYDDMIKVKGEYLHGLNHRRVYRAIVDGDCHQAWQIRLHLGKIDWMPAYSVAQISSALQGLRQKGLVEFNCKWDAV